MSKEELKAFLEKVKADASLQEKLKGAVDNNEVAAIAKSAGFEISTEQIFKAKAEIADRELEAVTGGRGDPLEDKLKPMQKISIDAWWMCLVW